MRTYGSAILMKISLVIFAVAVFHGGLWAMHGANSNPASLMQKNNSDTIRIKTSVVCGMCKDRVEGNMAFEKGVRDVSVDLDTKIVTLRYNPKSTTPEDLRKKISKLGYDADDVPADPKAYGKLPACCKKDVAPH